jgi:hypothetical protein
VTIHTVKGVEDVLICSHDCDCDPANVSGRGGILVAPIMPRPRLNDDADRIDALRQSWKLTDAGTFEFGHLFPLIEGSQEDAEFRVADFSRMISAGPGPKGLAMLKQRKAREFTEEFRGRLQLKLAAFLGRGGE